MSQKNYTLFGAIVGLADKLTNIAPKSVVFFGTPGRTMDKEGIDRRIGTKPPRKKSVVKDNPRVK